MKNIILISLLVWSSCFLSAQVNVTYSYTASRYDVRQYDYPIVRSGMYRGELKLTLTRKMKVSLSHCGSELNANPVTQILLSGRGVNLQSNSSVSCSNRNHAELSMFLEPGEYTVTSVVSAQGSVQSQHLLLEIETSRLEGEIDGKNNPIDLGILRHLKSYKNTRDSHQYKDTYELVPGRGGGDIWYRFVLPSAAKITYHHQSEISIFTTFFDENKERITSIPTIFPAGTYYFSCEGAGSQDGIITTTVEASYTNPPGNTREIPLDISLSSQILIDTVFANGFTDIFKSDGLKDIFYRFTLAESSLICVMNESTGEEYSEICLINDRNTSSLDYSGKKKFRMLRNLDAGTYYIVRQVGIEINEVKTSFQLLDPSEDHYDFNSSLSFPAYNSSMNYTAKAVMKDVNSGFGEIDLDHMYADITLNYFDGMGRLTQVIEKDKGPLQQDIISLVEYQNLGTIKEKWLPTPYSGDGSALGILALKDLAKDFYEDSNPYEKIVYETSPLNRILREHSSGRNWHVTWRGVEHQYLSNKSNECCYFVVDNNDCLVYLKDYPANTLNVELILDEDNKELYEYTDNLGRIILSRSIDNNIKHDTYYVYDDRNNLRAVIPPLNTTEIIGRGKNNPISLDDVNQLNDIYKYTYDNRGNCIRKYLPVGVMETFVYDKRNLLLFSRDRELEQKSQWKFYLYDKLGREVINGICSNTVVSSQVENWSVTAEFKPSTTGFLGTGYEVSGVTLVNPSFLVVNYYDTYDYQDLFTTNGSLLNFEEKYKYNNRYIYKGKEELSVRGLLTGSRSRLLDNSGKEIVSSYYYDDKDRLIQTRTVDHKQNLNVDFASYNFAGNLFLTHRTHTHTLYGTINTEYDYRYDRAGRLVGCFHRINGTSPQQKILDIDYDELGRKKRYNLLDGAEIQDFSYNVRGWLTEIRGEAFSQKIYYDLSDPNHTPSYNGNISMMEWKMKNDFKRKYIYKYDGLNRLVEGKYSEDQPRVSTLEKVYVGNPSYDESIQYDMNGNVTALRRMGLYDLRYGSRVLPDPVTGNLNLYEYTTYSFGEIDNLSYTYGSKLLRRIRDTAINEPLYEGAFNFVDGVNEAIEYRFDYNGNLTQDLNKGIQSIRWNIINLPEEISYKNGHKMKILYDATGEKREVEYTTALEPMAMPLGSYVPNASSQNKDTDIVEYYGDLMYVNGKPQLFTNNGYIYQSYNGSFIYYAYIKDYQGNIRAVIDKNKSLTQITHYYPFGMPFGEGSGSTFQPRKYNEKELHLTHGINLYDYGSRYYDPAIASWTSIDPLAEDYYEISPYAYVNNNPIRFIDPSGMAPNDTIIDGGNILYLEVTAPLKKEPVSGVWGHISYITSGGIDNGWKYDFDGNVIRRAPIMGLPPNVSKTSFLSWKSIKNIGKGIPSLTYSSKNSGGFARSILSKLNKKVSVQKQGRHIGGKVPNKGYTNSLEDAQKVLDAVHSGEATFLGVNNSGHIVVKYMGVTGINVNKGMNIASQPTNVFLIKGTVSPTVVPTNPFWGLGIR